MSAASDLIRVECVTDEAGGEDALGVAVGRRLVGAAAGMAQDLSGASIAEMLQCQFATPVHTARKKLFSFLEAAIHAQ